MEDSKLLTLISYIDEAPEMDSDQEDLERNLKEGVIKSTELDLLEQIGKEEFQYSWLAQKDVILSSPLTEQINFIHKLLDRIEEVYAFQFPIVFEFDKFLVLEFFEFLEFLEFNNISFISKVWLFLGKDPLEIDLDTFIEKQSQAIMKESLEVVDLKIYSNMITLFLRSYDSQKFLEWFKEHTKRNLVPISIKVKEGREEFYDSVSD